jgi:hypothetical protein
MVQTAKPSYINGANSDDKWCKRWRWRQLHRRLHLHVVLEEAAAERGLVGLPRRGLDGSLHPALRHGGGDDPDAPHGCVVVCPVRHRVLLLRAKSGAKRPVLPPDAVRKHPLEVLQPERVAAHGVEPLARPGISGTRRASALYMWYACRYELRALMMGLNGSLIRSPKCSLSQGLSLGQPYRRLRVTG